MKRKKKQCNFYCGILLQRLKLLNEAWSELKGMAATRGQKLDESMTYQQFLAKVEEEEAWIRYVANFLSLLLRTTGSHIVTHVLILQ